MTSGFLQKIESAIRDNCLLQSGVCPVIVGLSGGADSVALLVSLSRLGYRCIAAHCNFHLRGEESNRDCRHAQSIAAIVDAEFVCKDFNVAAYQSGNTSMSVEMACRELRYDWFEELRIRYGAQAIAVGHNADDNIETFLFNMQRGTGISGLRGMLPVNDSRIIRPMLKAHRDEIESFLKEAGVSYITDSTNLTNIYSRNKLRNIIIPAFESAFPNMRSGMDKTISHVAMSESFYRQAIEEKRRHYTSPADEIEITQLTQNEPHAALLLYEWLHPLGLTFSQAENIVSPQCASGSTFSSGETTWMLDRGKLIVIKLNDTISTFNDLFSIETLPIGEFRPSANPWEAFFDISVLEGSALGFRSWKPGDRIRPFGMRGTKKLSDIFNDAKIPRHIKDSIPLLTKDDEILWIPGIRASSCHSVTDDSTSFIRVSFIGPHLF